MAVRLFLVPMIGDGSQNDPYRGKYTDDPQVVRHGTLRFGYTDEAIVMIDAPASYLDTVQAQADAFLLATPQTIDDPITGGQRNTIQTWLEVRGIPAQWVQVGETRREVIRGVIGMFLLSQRLEGRFGQNFKQRAAAHGVNLETTWQALPQALKDELRAAADDWGIAQPPELTNASPLRDVLKAIGDGFQKFPYIIGGVTI